MFKNKRILGLITARGGSRRVKRKNVRIVGGRPLIAWTIAEAKKSKHLDRLVLSSENAEIISTAIQWGCEAPFIRPEELSGDDTPGIEPVLHAVKMLPGYDYVVLLQPTSPLRTSRDIDSCIEFCLQKNAKACVSVAPVDKPPCWMYFMGKNHRLKPLMPVGESAFRHQDTEPVYIINGAVYIAACDWLSRTRNFITGETLGYEMPGERSLDIDTETDIIFTDWIKSRRRIKLCA